MSYNTVAEIQRRTGIGGNPNISTVSIGNTIARADGIVNGFIGEVYALPLSETPALIQELAGAMAEAIILKEQYGPEVEDTDKDGYKKYDSVIDDLKRIQTREIKVFSDTTSTELTTNATTKPRSFPDANSDLLTNSSSTAPRVRMGDKY